MKQFQYIDKSGQFDYERYRRVQTETNQRKLNSQWVDENSVKYLADYIRKHVTEPRFGICHGTRQGLEQAWFSKHLEGCEVIGTEISDTATRFPKTVQWDFHEDNPIWAGRADFVYSNSWDHSYDPVKMFRAWLTQLSIGGLLLLEHSVKGHNGVSESDPFGANVDELIHLLTSIDHSTYKYVETLADAPPIQTNSHKFRRDIARGMDVQPTYIPVSYVVIEKAY